MVRPHCLSGNLRCRLLPQHVVQQVVARLAHVASHRLSSGFCRARAHRLEHGGVLGQRVLPNVKDSARFRAGILQQRRQRAHRGHQNAVVCCRKNDVVKGEVSVDKPTHITVHVGLTHTGEESIELVNVVIGTSGCGKLGCPGFKHDTHVEEVKRCAPARTAATGIPQHSFQARPLINRGNAMPAARYRNNHSLRLQQAHAFTQRETGDTEHLGQVCFGRQRLPRHDAPRDDLIEQPVNDGLRTGDSLDLHTPTVLVFTASPWFRPEKAFRGKSTDYFAVIVLSDRRAAEYARRVTERAPLSRKLSAIAESATLKVDAKAKALKAEGRPVISYAAGEPDFPTPKFIVDAGIEAMHNPANFRYTPAAGLPELREAIAAKTLRDSGLAVEPSQIIVTNGGKQAVYQAFQAVVNPGDEVLLPAPYWTTYPEAIALADGVPVEVFAGSEQEYKVTVEQLEAARTEKTTVLVFVSPSNPTGSVYTPEETKAIGEWALEHGIWVISDEIYQNLVYEGTKAVSIVEAVPELANQTILVNGVAKTYAMTGWRVGWMVGPKDAIKVAANLQSHLSSNVNNVAQRGAIAALTGPQAEVEQMRQAFDRRRQLIVAELSKIDGMKVPNPLGAFYVYPDVTGLLGKTWRGKTPTTSLELADLILDEVEVAVVPGEAFGPSGFIRMSYALGDEELLEGVRRLQELFS